MADEHLPTPGAEPPPHGMDPTEPARMAVATVREPDMELLERVEGELADVERVLPRIDDGTYGICEVCGEAIPDAHLAASPVARFCAGHSA